MTTRCLIVDDEPLAIKVIQSHLEKVPDIEVVTACNNALKAFDIVHKQHIDLIFLDIEMPELTGLDFLKTLERPPAIIFTTAYREYALDGFELDVVDYLLKPISFPRFLRAIDKYRRLHVEQTGRTSTTKSSAYEQVGYLQVKADRKVVNVQLEDILFIESLNDYVKIHTTGRPVITKERISRMADKLAPHGFIRIHRSYIISESKITAYSTEEAQIGTVRLPISRTYRQVVNDRLSRGESFV